MKINTMLRSADLSIGLQFENGGYQQSDKRRGRQNIIALPVRKHREVKAQQERETVPESTPGLNRFEELLVSEFQGQKLSGKEASTFQKHSQAGLKYAENSEAGSKVIARLHEFWA